MALANEQFEPKPFGRYVLLDKLAVGGMAEIYKAKTYGVDGFEKLLAIKRILPHCAADKEFINMLVDEAKLTVLLSHANIVQVYDLGKVGDDYFISMEYINGTNLRELINRSAGGGEKITEEIAVYIMSETCKGLDYAHRKSDSQGAPLNIVHRDISPQNILISFEGEVKIVDFGIAKAAMNVSHTMAGILKGKIAYMSPEQALGKPIDHRTDIFSAGVVLYEMLTGEKLFTGETQFEVLNKIRTTRVNTMMLPEQIPGPLKAVLCKALAYNSKDRYQSVGDFQLDLTKYLYSSYIDFSPRNLASIVSRLFTKEIHRKEITPSIDEKTRSVLIKQASEEAIVVHGATPQAAPRRATTQKTAVSGLYVLQAVKKLGRAGAVLGLLAVAAATGYFGYQFFTRENKGQISEPPPVISRPRVAELGTFIVNSNPPGARIYLNDADTGFSTPATIQNLGLGKEYEIRLSKEKYEDRTKKYALTSTIPLQVDETLVPMSLGQIEITSTPAGARLYLDGKLTTLLTPGRIENLKIPSTYQIRLTLPNHAEWSTAVEVKNLEPVKLAATLAPLPVVEQPVVPPPAPPSPSQTVAYGRLEVRSDPSEAKILINGRDTGKLTPAIIERLEAGRPVSVTVSKKGYASWKRQSPAIQGNETSSLMAALKKEEAKPVEEKPTPPPPPPPPTGGKNAGLRLTSEPEGADVYINAEFKGRTPLSLSDLPSGSVKLLVSKEGFLKYTTSFNLQAGESKSLGTIQLQDPFGELSISSTPPKANIYFDGDLIAPKTPVTIKKVPREGGHSIRLELEGFEKWEASFSLKESPTKIYNVTLEKK